MMDAPDRPDSVDLEFRLEMKRAVEAMLFAAEEALTTERLESVFLEVTGTESHSDVREIIAELNADYSLRGSALTVVEWGGGFRLAVRPEADPYVQGLFQTERSIRLSRSLLETLAVIAYRQPVTRPEIDFVRGVDSDYAVRKLLEHRLVDVIGRSDSLGRPLLYGTTDAFLDQFGLASLDNLPTMREIEEILEDPAFDRERARLFEFQQQEDALAQIEPDADSESDSNEEQEGS